MLALLLQLAATDAAPQSPPPVTDWPNLPPLRLDRPWAATPDMARFVHDEVIAGRCAAARPDQGRYQLRVDVVVLVAAGGGVKQVAPAPIGCPTVEQYTAGIVSSLTREHLVGPPPASDAWLRASVTYSWSK